MGTRALKRAGGLAVGTALLAVAFRPAIPAARRPADIHAEFIRYVSGRDWITAYIAYPERRDAAPAVIVIHEIFGRSDFIKRPTRPLPPPSFPAPAPALAPPPPRPPPA